MLIIFPDRIWNKVEESKIREYFSRRRMPVFHEIRSANPAYDEGALGFEFQLHGDARTIARLCVSVFAELYGATDQYGSSFTTFEL